MKNLKSQEEIKINWKSNIEKALVSIQCLAYNHEQYIEDALEGFLIQETNFPFEIIIHDDASTDSTADIIRKYEEKYPDIIKPIYQEENQFSQGKKQNVRDAINEKINGKYIALCEGDDYWTDPLKLQIQIDFLEEHKEYVISGHDAFIIDENGKHLKDSKLPDIHKKDFDGEDLILTNTWILTLSWVFRNVFSKQIPNELNMVLNGDKFLTSLLGHYGKSKYHDDIKPAGYRVHSDGVWSLLSEQEKHDARLNTFFWMYRYYTRIGEEEYAKHFLSKYHTLVLSGMESDFIAKALTGKHILKALISKSLKRIFRPLRYFLEKL